MNKLSMLLFVLALIVSILLPSASAFSLDFLTPTLDYTQCSALPSLEKVSCVVGLQGNPDITDIANVLSMAVWLLTNDFQAFLLFALIVFASAMLLEKIVSFWFPKMEIAKSIFRIIGAGIGVFYVIPFILG